MAWKSGLLELAFRTDSLHQSARVIIMRQRRSQKCELGASTYLPPSSHPLSFPPFSLFFPSLPLLFLSLFSVPSLSLEVRLQK